MNEVKPRKIMLVAGNLKTELDVPILVQDHQLKILLIGDTVKDVSMTNMDFAKCLSLRAIVERIKEIHIYVEPPCVKKVCEGKTT